MICVICREEGYYQTTDEPEEPCLCGELAKGSLWGWDRWRACRNAARYRLAEFLVRAGNQLAIRPYR